MKIYGGVEVWLHVFLIFALQGFEWQFRAPAALPLVPITQELGKRWSQSGKGKGKALPLQAWAGPEGSRRLRLPDFKTIGT